MDPFRTWTNNRRDVITELTRLAQEMQKHAKKAKIVSAIGTGTGIVSGVATAVFVFAAPATLGASLIPALTGIAFVGGLTSVGSSITKNFIEEGYMKDVERALNRDRAAFEELIRCIEIAKSTTTAEVLQQQLGVAKKICSGFEFGTCIVKELKVSGKTAKILLKLSKTARFAGKVMTFIAIPMDIALFMKDAIDLAKGNVSFAADQVLKLAKDLEEEFNEIIEQAQ